MAKRLPDNEQSGEGAATKPPTDTPDTSTQSGVESSATGQDQVQAGSGDNAGGVTLPTIAESHTEAYAGFDPSIHAMNDDGTPKKKADGSFALKRGRKAGSAGSALPPKNAPAKNGVGVPGIDSRPKISSDEAARQSANMVINVAVWTLGEEIGKPTDKAEADGLLLSFKNYYDSRGVPDIPPEIGLFVALGAYIGPRLMHEKSKSKIEKAKLWIASKLHK